MTQGGRRSNAPGRRASPAVDVPVRRQPSTPRVDDVPYLTATEVARLLRLNPKKIYALVQAGRMPAARVSGKWLFPRQAVERWVSEHTVYPSEGPLHALLGELVVMQGSDDWLLDRSLETLRSERGSTVLTATVGSMAGLRALAERRAHVATCHVDDDAVASVGRGRDVWYLVALSRREQGLMVRRGMRRKVRDMQSVVSHGLRFADRQPSAGTHRLARRLVTEAGASPDTLRVSGTHHSHLEVGMAVRAGEADAGLGIRVAAERCGLDFVPVGTETFELAVPGPVLSHPRGAQFLEHLLDVLSKLGRGSPPGYDLTSLGRVRAAPTRARPEPLV